MSEVFFFVVLGSHGTKRELFSAGYYLSGGGGGSMGGYGGKKRQNLNAMS